jgi:hypothetical protein
MLALAIRAMGVESLKDVMYFQPSDPRLELDPAIGASLLTKEIMATFRAFRTPLAIFAGVWWSLSVRRNWEFVANAAGTKCQLRLEAVKKSARRTQ